MADWISIRYATPEDYPRLQELNALALQEMNGEWTRDGPQVSDIQKNLVVVLELNDTVQGWCQVDQVSDWLEHIYVHPEWRKKKMGDALLFIASHLLPDTFYAVIENPRSVDFYRKSGFEVQATEDEDIYSICYTRIA